MSTTDIEGEGALVARFAGKFGSIPPERRDERKSLERKATRTQGERNRAPKGKTVLMNFKMPEATRDTLKRLAAERGMTMTEVVELGIKLAAEKLSQAKGGE